MKSIVISILLCTLPIAAQAGECRPIVRSQFLSPTFHAANIAVVPFAVPVAVPVATVNQPQVFYQAGFYGPTANPTANTTSNLATNNLATASTPSAITPGALSKCIQCHSTNNPLGGLDLSNLSALTALQKLESIRRMTTSDPTLRMPKGSDPLSPAALGEAIESLAK